MSTPPRGEEPGRASPRIRPYLAGPPVGSPAPEWSPAVEHPAPDVRPELRPFILTSGRVRGIDPDVGLETQVTTRPDAPARHSVGGALTPELHAIVDLCRVSHSVAEISARLRLHLGVTKILVGDLCAAGFLDIHLLDLTTARDPDTILRVIHGLRAIS